ncbi:MAG: ACT domain-containing protein [Pseudomonadota bacterium]
MNKSIKDTQAMIAGMAPVLDADTWNFCTTKDQALADKTMPLALAFFDEDEGKSFILLSQIAKDFGFECELPMARITLSVHSALDGVGLTAAVAGLLAEHAIPCNMVAAFHHDHVFVPAEQAERAMALLKGLAAGKAA